VRSTRRRHPVSRGGTQLITREDELHCHGNVAAAAAAAAAVQRK